MDTLFGLQMTTIAAVLGSALTVILLALGLLAWRNRVMFKLGLRPIPRRQTQSSLIVLGLMLATLIITAAFVTGDTLSHTIRSRVIEDLGPVDEIVRLRSNGSSTGTTSDTYFSLSRFEELNEQLAGDPLVEISVPAIRESLPAINQTQRQSIRALQVNGMPPEHASLILPTEERTSVDGVELSLNALDGRELFLNEAAAQALDAQPGDVLELYYGAAPKRFVVAGVSEGGLNARALMTLRQTQALLGQHGRINHILLSNTGDAFEGARHSEQVTARVRSLLTDESEVRRLMGRLGSDPGAAQELREAAASYEGNTREDLLTLAAGIEAGAPDETVRSLLADEALGAEVLSILEAADWQTEAHRRRLEDQFGRLSDYSVEDVKRDGLDAAEQAANAFTTMFVVTGLFGIASGLLLIFLIFVMLAAERKSEMGMSRAIGAQRSHLIQMFLYEGTAYDLAAALVGVALGTLTGMIVALTLGRAFASTDLAIRPHVTIVSLAVSYCLGMLVTFATVLFSARRVSRLNIVAAIRDLPEPPTQQAPVGTLLLAPLRALLSGIHALVGLRVIPGLRAWLIEVPRALLGLIWAGFRNGPLTLLLGLVLTPAGVTGESGALFATGVSLGLLGVGLTLHRILTRVDRGHRERIDRAIFTALGLALIIFWSLPTESFEPLGVTDLRTGPEMLFIAGFMLVVGAVMVVMYNTDLLLRTVLRVFGGNRRLAPVLRMAVAYPLANRFRTGLTLGMFGIVIFSVVFLATAFQANRAFFANTDALTGGFDMRALASANNPIPNLARSVSAKPVLREYDFEAVASEYTIFAELQQEGESWQGYPVRAVDDAYLRAVGYDIAVKAEGFETEEEIWRAVGDRPGYAVIDSYPVPSRQTTHVVIGGPEFQLEGIYQEDETMEPIRLRVREDGGATFEVTVIGVVDPSAFMNFGLITSQSTLDRSLPNPPEPTKYYMKLPEAADPGEIAAALEGAFMEYGLEAVDQIQEIEDVQASQRAVEKLMLGFLTLGLIVGVAALGVISSRAVVERRQQIGVLRALGFQAEMVTWSFMVEASFVALLGITIGVALAFVSAYQMITDLASEIPGLTFQIPWGSVALIVGLAYSMALLATYLPARQAARVAPAEALRYE